MAFLMFPTIRLMVVVDDSAISCKYQHIFPRLFYKACRTVWQRIAEAKMWDDFIFSQKKGEQPAASGHWSLR